jgi:hypothetical protein
MPRQHSGLHSFEIPCGQFVSGWTKCSLGKGHPGQHDMQPLPEEDMNKEEPIEVLEEKLGVEPRPIEPDPHEHRLNETVLEEAHRIIGGARAGDYGENSQGRIATYWRVYMLQKYGKTPPLNGRDVSAMMILLKLARDTHKPKRDNPVDIAGYAELMERPE